MIQIVHEVWLLPRNAAIACMHAYRRLVSPLYGEVCRYYPSCSRYAVEAYQLRGFTVGTALTAWRLLRCNPFTAGGVDDVPPRAHAHYVTNTRGFVRPIERKA
ncbi:membrane protein insertion efficiency factor YidD [Leucobacter japonicus]|uniref:membrane protein insertion efficiency factor YidD n=1 Tax=Leucobacter japonicus TaxID=1461259 RepID=UPI0006A7CA30|nr:membrane protein insertion efficiency factor YidD [Leucobacter japonicus]